MAIRRLADDPAGARALSALLGCAPPPWIAGVALQIWVALRDPPFAGASRRSDSFVEQVDDQFRRVGVDRSGAGSFVVRRL
jgi:hypothetical protein